MNNDSAMMFMQCKYHILQITYLRRSSLQESPQNRIRSSYAYKSSNIYSRSYWEARKISSKSMKNQMIINIMKSQHEAKTTWFPGRKEA